MIQSATAFAVAAQEARLEAVVSMGQWLASPIHPSLATRQTWLADQILSMVPGVAHVRVNPGYFADNYLQLIDYAAHLGVFPTITGNGKDAPPSNEDIARVVVAVLMDPDKHAGKVYRPTGPALLSGNDMAEILSRVLGRKVRRVDLPWRLFLKAARTANVGAFLVSNLRYYRRRSQPRCVCIGRAHEPRSGSNWPSRRGFRNNCATLRRPAGSPEEFHQLAAHVCCLYAYSARSWIQSGAARPRTGLS